MYPITQLNILFEKILTETFNYKVSGISTFEKKSSTLVLSFKIIKDEIHIFLTHKSFDVDTQNQSVVRVNSDSLTTTFNKHTTLTPELECRTPYPKSDKFSDQTLAFLDSQLKQQIKEMLTYVDKKFEKKNKPNVSNSHNIQVKGNTSTVQVRGNGNISIISNS